jgi:hypothetical protein|tara:strand:+ start:1072 stop:1407 length:336 start_codon:yes stop_codon:yes gene_type:complete
MAVYVSNIVVEQGFDFDTSFQLEDSRTSSPLILTNASTEAQLRKYYGSSTSVSFGTTVTEPSEGLVSISLTASQTVNIKPGRYVFDLKITNGGTEFKAVEGSVLVRGGVTR